VVDGADEAGVPDGTVVVGAVVVVGGAVVVGVVVVGVVVVGVVVVGAGGGGAVVVGTVDDGGGGAVVVDAGLRSSRVATVTMPRPRMEKAWGPWTASVASNMALASVSVTVARAPTGGGAMSRPPWSRSTEEAKRAVTTAAGEGASGDEGGFKPTTPPHAARPAALRITMVVARKRAGALGTGHSLARGADSRMPPHAGRRRHFRACR
jgi:hypothetical protein